MIPATLLVRALPYIGIVAVIAFGVWTIRGVGYDECKAEWDTEKTAQQQAHLAAVNAAQAKIIDLERAKNENLSEIRRLRDDVRTVRVRVPAKPAACPAPGTTASEPAGAGVVSTDPQTGFDRFRQLLESEAERADAVVEECRAAI